MAAGGSGQQTERRRAAGELRPCVADASRKQPEQHVVAWQQCQAAAGAAIVHERYRRLLFCALHDCPSKRLNSNQTNRLQVKSTKMNRTIVVRRDYLHYIKKYQVRCVCCGCPVFSHISSRSLASAGLMPRMRGGALPSCP